MRQSETDLVAIFTPILRDALYNGGGAGHDARGLRLMSEWYQLLRRTYGENFTGSDVLMSFIADAWILDDIEGRKLPERIIGVAVRRSRYDSGTYGVEVYHKTLGHRVWEIDRTRLVYLPHEHTIKQLAKRLARRLGVPVNQNLRTKRHGRQRVRKHYPRAEGTVLVTCPQCDGDGCEACVDGQIARPVLYWTNAPQDQSP